MCLIIECNKHIPISYKLMEEFQRRNDDGFGFMWVQDGELKTYKTPNGSLEELYAKYQELMEFDPVIHLRQKTHGLIDHENTHPYPVGTTGIWLMHNGVLSGGNQEDTSKSDTWHFINRVIEPILSWAGDPGEAIRSKKFRILMERIIGSTNRICLGDKDGYVFFNQDAWTKISNENTGAKGLRVSNSYAWSEGFADPKVVTPTSTHSHSTGSSSSTGNVTNLTSYRRNSTTGMIQIDQDLYADEDGEIWEMDKGVLWRMAEGTKRVKKAKKRLRRLERRMEQLVQPSPPKQAEIPTLLLPPPKEDAVCVPGTEPIIVVTKDASEEHSEIVLPDESYDAKDAYLEALEKEWGQMSLANLNAMVYTDPDSAAMLLYKRLQNG